MNCVRCYAIHQNDYIDNLGSNELTWNRANVYLIQASKTALWTYKRHWDGKASDRRRNRHTGADCLGACPIKRQENDLTRRSEIDALWNKSRLAQLCHIFESDRRANNTHGIGCRNSLYAGSP